MDTSKIIKGAVSNGRYTVTAPIVKEDYGLYLQIEGVELPETYQVDFSNEEHHGTSVTMIGNADGVKIPRQFIDTGKDVFAFLYWVGEDYGKTVYKFRIPNKVRPDRTNEQPTPEEQSVIDQAIGALNEAVEQTAQDVIDADASAQSASQSAENAHDSAVDAQNYAESAQTSANNASASASQASGYAQTAETAKTDAQTAKTQAETARDEAVTAKTVAETAQGKAEDAQAAAESVAESIPSDYSQLSEDVSDLKEGLNALPSVKETDSESGVFDFADAQGNVLVRFANGHIRTKFFDSSVIKPTGSVEWKFSGDDLLLAYGYNDTVDAVVVLNEGRANGLFDFAKLCTKPKGADLSELEIADLTVVWNSGTDMHAPFQFLAVNNADGYHADATSPSWVGGNHTLDQMGAEWKTASSKFVHYFADGNEVASGNGKCNHFEIKWANGVQAYNTAKQGGGRECLTEYHDMIFDGVRFNEVIRLVPSEDIKMKLWYGLQFVSWAGKYANIVFEDAINRQTFISTDSDIASGNPVTSGMFAWGDDDAIEVTVDTTFDLGKRDYYRGSQGAFTTGSHKGYFTIIGTSDMVNMDADTNWFLRGSYRFFSA